MPSIFDRFFKTEEDDEIPAEARQKCEVVLEFARSGYYRKLLDWLEGEAMRPVTLSEGRDMVISAARQNAFLEVRRHILSEVEKAGSLLKRSYGS